MLKCLFDSEWARTPVTGSHTMIGAFWQGCQVVDTPEILAVIEQVPFLSDFLNSLYGCQYKNFFIALGKSSFPSESQQF